jgi:serine/threonine-protein kinase
MTMEEIRTPDRPKLYHYKLDRILGQGGTGVVYRGIDMNKGEVFAIKRFHENFFRNSWHLRELKNTVKKIRKFEHVNVVRIYDFLETDPSEGNCMIMEYVDGPNLNWYLKNRPYKLQERIGIAQQLCSGLQYLHDNGCVHHDFKPANVLFTRRGVAKVADFSLYGGGGMLNQIFMGKLAEQITPMFVAPEFLRKSGVTAKVDQYSLGVTLYMMFADAFPYSADSLQKLYQMHLVMEPLHPADVKPECPRAIGDIVMRLLAKKPGDRFSDCDEARIALSRAGQSRI